MMIIRFALILLFLTVIGCSRATPTAPSQQASRSAAVNSTSGVVPVATSNVDLQILDWDGLRQLIDSHRGKVIVLDCWSTSCQPCIKEFPNLVELDKKHRDNGVACISLSFDYEGIGRPEEQREHVLAFLQDKQATFDNVLSTLDSDALSTKLDIPSIPAVFVYDQQGKLHRRFDNRHAADNGGPFTYKQVQAVVEELIAAKPG